MLESSKITPFIFLISNILNIFIISKIYQSQFKKKTLYLHVGPHKTGSSIIQLECTNHRNQLKKNKILYPSSITSFFEADTNGWINHSDIAWMVKKGNLKFVKLYIYLIKFLSMNYDAVLLSSEDFSPSILMDFDHLNSEINSMESENFIRFMDFLHDNFNLKILFCSRNYADRVASASAMLGVTAPEVILSYSTIDSYIINSKIKNDVVEDYYRKAVAKILSYEKLEKTKKFVHSFLKEALDIDIYIPDKKIHQTGNYTVIPVHSNELLSSLEKFYSPLSESLFSSYRNGDIDETTLATKLKDFTRAKVYKLFPNLEERKGNQIR